MSEKKTEADDIWTEIAVLPINLFGLTNQVVAQHVTKVPLPGKELYLKLSAGAVLPALEEALGKKYSVEMGMGYTIVRRASDRDAMVAKAVQEAAQKR